ncbi:MAG: PorT family protein [Bacteroidales bacterium]|nr:PorT family protein [Bacteroidales bacterium]
MKKNLLFIGLMMAFSLSVSAQNEGFAFGFKFGPNFGWTGSTTATADNLGSKTGFDVGVVSEYYFADNYAFVTGVNVSFLGGHYMFDNAHLVTDSLNPDGFLEKFGVDRTYKSTIYEIPLMLKMVTNELGNVPLRIYAEVGGGIGLAAKKVRVKDAIPSQNVTAPDKWSTTNKEYSNLRASLKIGAGAQYTVDESTRLFAGVYFSHDFINMINYIRPDYCGNFFDAEGNKIGERDPKLNVLQNRIGIEVGVLF